MKILFCKISSMKYYKGASENDKPYNGGSFVDENGYGHEQYNFDPIEFKNGQYCLGFVETKNTSKHKTNDLHIEKISGCDMMKDEDYVKDILVIWCATTDLNETSVMGWYKNATVYRTYQEVDFDNGYIQCYNVLAKKENCVLLPKGARHKKIWDAPTSKKCSYGFGQSMVWYANEEKAKNYINKLKEQIDQYYGDNWIDKSVDDI